MKNVFFIIMVCCLLFSCKQNDEDDYSIIDCPSSVKSLAFSYAQQYENADTQWVLGGQDALRVIKIDCSGLVVRCYQYAIENTNYELILSDMSSAWMYENAVTFTDNPQKGDLIFMGDVGSPYINHVAIFEKKENGNIYFIDSTQKDTNNDGIDDINGVTERFYAENDSRIRAFGIMKLKEY